MSSFVVKSLVFFAAVASATTPAPESEVVDACEPQYDVEICDDGDGVESTTTHTIYPTGCATPSASGWEAWSTTTTTDSSVCTPHLELEICDEEDGSESTKTITVYPTGCTASPDAAWQTWSASPTDPSDDQATTWEAWFAAPTETSEDDPTTWEAWSAAPTETSDDDPTTWQAWSTTETADPTTQWGSWEQHTTTAKPADPTDGHWSSWVPDSPKVITTTITTTFLVPCSTGYSTSTYFWTTTHCGCTETPAPQVPVVTVTKSVPADWPFSTSVVVVVPDPAQPATWDSWVAPTATPAKPVDPATNTAWSGWSTSVKPASDVASPSSQWQEWSATGTGVAAYSATPVEGIKTYTGAAAHEQAPRVGTIAAIAFFGVLNWA